MSGMSKKYKDTYYWWDKYWAVKEAIGMVHDHPTVADMDYLVTNYEMDYLLNKKSNKINNGGFKMLGRLGRKCDR